MTGRCVGGFRRQRNGLLGNRVRVGDAPICRRSDILPSVLGLVAMSLPGPLRETSVRLTSPCFYSYEGTY